MTKSNKETKQGRRTGYFITRETEGSKVYSQNRLASQRPRPESQRIPSTGMQDSVPCTCICTFWILDHMYVEPVSYVLAKHNLCENRHPLCASGPYTMGSLHSALNWSWIWAQERTLASSPMVDKMCPHNTIPGQVTNAKGGFLASKPGNRTGRDHGHRLHSSSLSPTSNSAP